MLDLSSIVDKQILIAALDWGFGHTTRSLVLIKTLLKQNNQITFAGNEKQIEFIRSEISNINTLVLPGYNITLNSSKNTYFQVIRQFLKIRKIINLEHKWLQDKLKENIFDFIISDNRYGFYHHEIPSILLTHQTALQIPVGKCIANHFLRNRINRFSTCWIPDYESQSLSGKLSSGKLKIPCFFIGPLSRFEFNDQETPEYDYLFLISGPPPERDFFFTKSIQYINQYNLNGAIAVPFKNNNKSKDINCHVFEELNTKHLQELINKSKVVISKAGYTTVMDFVPTGKKIILIPTDGQYEQIYLCKHLHGKEKVLVSSYIRLPELF